MEFTLIGPPAYEAALGGMIGAGERAYRGKAWRVELWASGEGVRISREGRALSWEQAPEHARRLAWAVFNTFQPGKGAAHV